MNTAHCIEYRKEPHERNHAPFMGFAIHDRYYIPFFADTRSPSTIFASGVTYADQFLW